MPRQSVEGLPKSWIKRGADAMAVGGGWLLDTFRRFMNHPMIISNGTTRSNLIRLFYEMDAFTVYRLKRLQMTLIGRILIKKFS